MILWKTDPRRGRLVVACDVAARRMGVRSGIAIAQATELACSAGDKITPIVAEHDSVADSIALERVSDALQNRISPLVAVESLGKRPWSGQVLLEPDTLFCDLSGVTHLFGDELGIMRAVSDCLAEFGLVGKLAIADNPAAAWAHAHYNVAENFISTQAEDDLQSLPVNALRIESEIKHTLDRLGIETIGALLRLPRGGLARRLGDGIVKRIAEILGEVEVPLEIHHPELRHHSTHELEYPTDDLEILVDRLGRLTQQIVASLAASQRGALRLACRLDLEGRSQLNTVIGLFAPTLDQKHLHCLISSSIESLKIPSPITGITLSVLQCGPLRTQQNSLFGDEEFGVENGSVADHSLSRLVDELSSRLGREAVLGIRLSDNPLPEKAFRTYSLTDHRTRTALRRLPSKERTKRSVDASFRKPGPRDARRRPMRLLRKPVRLTPVETSRRESSRPNRALPSFRLDGRIHRAAYFWGPERIETGWWEGPTIRRDYFRVETDTGNLWWLFRDLRLNEWFLHGRFF